ncbi:Gfo/Idh/MocA family protein [Stackebrandtia nassauensis]|uniref:Oxidoreductase domain protein n=1 Tax=Stackebrandtia nassauensis (strain DSM 44728 / CIP 108903 / NRRL B-16338 / NBRC 102104 / LLR-40K-21) TaxID=446470 RepID=D3QA75_STANL|nr:Gfo/Idh/MocA family oxidoreductase [Stackebrandtia nassauensis]ADD40787.1 oxidoreductase domain protein [Stackebrandtia nassauensis DSM 44728]
MTSRIDIGIAVNGVTGRMGYRQHLVRSLLAIREQGGLPRPDGSVIWPELTLVGRNAAKLAEVAERHGIERYSTDLPEVLTDPSVSVYFDALTTQHRLAAVSSAIKAGKHVYCEKPIATSLDESLDLVRLAREHGVKNGAVADKLYLPGLLKLKRLIDSGFFGRILSVRGEFGYWVFEGDWQAAQRPSWNYRSEDGGGMALDMFPHWSYVFENLIAPVKSVTAHVSTHVPRRFDESGKGYPATADDAAYAIFELEGGVVAQMNSSWTTRVFRDELVEFQVDGTEGSAVAGLRRCRAQHRSVTPKPVWNPDIDQTVDFRSQWSEVPDNAEFDNGFKTQWEEFLRHVVDDAPWHHDFLAASRGVQLAEAGYLSSTEGRRVELPQLTL